MLGGKPAGEVFVGAHRGRPLAESVEERDQPVVLRASVNAKGALLEVELWRECSCKRWRMRFVRPT